MSRTVTKNPKRFRYELTIDGELLGIAEYVERGDVVELPHTVIERHHRGHGLGAVLVQAALDDVRASGRTVIPTCSYVDEFIATHTDYQDLLAS